MTCPKCKGVGEYSYVDNSSGIPRFTRFKCWACDGARIVPEGTVFVSTADLVKCYAEKNDIAPGKIKVSYP